MKIPTDQETNFMEPMTEEQVQTYSEFVVSEMDEEKVISGAGMEFITRADNIPNEEDQERVMTRIEEIYNERKNKTDAEPKEGVEAVESTESEGSKAEEEASDKVAETEAVVATEVE